MPPRSLLPASDVQVTVVYGEKAMQKTLSMPKVLSVQHAKERAQLELATHLSTLSGFPPIVKFDPDSADVYPSPASGEPALGDLVGNVMMIFRPEEDASHSTTSPVTDTLARTTSELLKFPSPEAATSTTVSKKNKKKKKHGKQTEKMGLIAPNSSGDLSHATNLDELVKGLSVEIKGLKDVILEQEDKIKLLGDRGDRFLEYLESSEKEVEKLKDEMKDEMKGLKDQNGELKDKIKGQEDRIKGLEDKEEIFKQSQNELRRLTVMIAPIHIRVLLDQARLKIVEASQYPSWEELSSSCQLPELKRTISTTHGITETLASFICEFSNVRRDGNEAAHTAERCDIRSGVMQKPEGPERRLLEQAYEFVFSQDINLEDL